jgi:DNA-binding transcriptional ArsR family regulator
MLVGMLVMGALGDETRVGIVEALAGRDLSVGELVGRFSVSQPAISRHLRILREAGVVSVQPRGKQRIYRLEPASLVELTTWADGCISAWRARFDALGEHLDRMAAASKHDTGQRSSKQDTAMDRQARHGYGSEGLT